jgi:ATP-dependent Clp protease ATP-binding subunit ClpC
LTLAVTAEVAQWIVDQTCTDRSYGARPLRRAIQKFIEDPLSDALLTGRFDGVSQIEVYVDGAGLQYRPATRDDLAQPDEVLVG